MKKLVLLRHGESQWNLENRFTGWTNVDLTQKGKEEAKKAKQFYDEQVQVTGDLSFVKGNEWLAGNISYHLDERPKWIYDSNNIFLCNINLECIKYK